MSGVRKLGASANVTRDAPDYRRKLGGKMAAVDEMDESNNRTISPNYRSWYPRPFSDQLDNGVG